MKENRIRKLLAEGKRPVGHMISEFSTRGIAKITEGAGVDFVFIDMEHGGLEISVVADMLAWFKATPVTPIVRVPSSDYHFIARVMDMGAQGVMVPNVRTPEQARQSINALRYRPEGKRGLGLGMAQNDYLPPNAAQYLREANENHTFVCQIESVTALKNLDEIASMPGVDILWVGHFDLTSSMGIVAQFDHPDFLDALRKVADAAKRHGKAAGIQPNSIEQAKLWIAQGYNVISYGVDHGVYRRALQEGVDAMRQLP